jgi:dolichol kinase
MPILREHPPSPRYQVASNPSQITWKNELLRKSIHLTSIAIPTLYIWLSKWQALRLLIPLLAIAIIIEVLRHTVPAAEAIFRRLFGAMLRTHERGGDTKASVNGATYVLLSATLCVAIFPKVVTIAGFSVLIVSDTVAALFGRRFGRHRFLEKSVEGSAAFFVSAMVMVVIVAMIFSAPASFIVAGALAAAAATVAEALSYGVNVDDNLTIPLSFGAVMWGMLLLLGGADVAGILATP